MTNMKAVSGLCAAGPREDISMFRTGFRALAAFVVIAAALAFVAVEADAAPKFNAGSRGSKTFSAPPPTATAPNAARPIERTMTQPGQPGGVAGAPSAARPGAPAAPGGFFNRPGLLGGLAAGFLGAGLIGMLFGNGLMGGLGGMASFLGLILQVGILAMIAMFVWRWWQRRSQPAAAFAGGPGLRVVTPDFQQPRASFGGFGGSSPAPVSVVPIETSGEDFDAFERILGEVQTAYGAEDLGALRALMTPEMLSYYAEELAKNSSRGVVNRISDVKLLQGDLAEAWREGNADYATVAMRYGLVDRTLDRTSGRMVEGSTNPQEATELWTFRRAGGGHWALSAVQQA
jgi:predicted lipid-binding transport protein (Tim44 family)